jgi:glycosyltransferase involved in cell wall biosynthesis
VKHSVLYLQYTNPANYPPLEHSGLILLNEGWDVQYFGIQSEGESSKLVFAESLAGRVSLWRHQSAGFRQKLHFLAFTLVVLWKAWLQRPVWIYCSDLMSCPAAWLIKRFTRCKVLYHEHDSPEDGGRRTEDRGQNVKWGRQMADGRWQISSFQRFLLWTRKRVGREADLVVLPNQKRLELFCQATSRRKPSLCVFNCPRKEEAGKPKGEIGNRKSEIGNGEAGQLRLGFVGSINRDRLPMAVLEAMSRLSGRVHLSVVGYETLGTRNYMKEFLAAASRLGLAGFVDFRGALPRREDILVQAASCDVGLAFMPTAGGDVNMENMTGASNKPFDYLACGLALLVSARPEWEEMFVQPGYGPSCDPGNAESIARQLIWFLQHPAETRAMGERGRQRILTEWNYENQFAPVFAKLQTPAVLTNTQ